MDNEILKSVEKHVRKCREVSDNLHRADRAMKALDSDDLNYCRIEVTVWSGASFSVRIPREHAKMVVLPALTKLREKHDAMEAEVRDWVDQDDKEAA